MNQNMKPPPLVVRSQSLHKLLGDITNTVNDEQEDVAMSVKERNRRSGSLRRPFAATPVWLRRPGDRGDYHQASRGRRLTRHPGAREKMNMDGTTVNEWMIGADLDLLQLMSCPPGFVRNELITHDIIDGCLWRCEVFIAIDLQLQYSEVRALMRECVRATPACPICLGKLGGNQS